MRRGAGSMRWPAGANRARPALPLSPPGARACGVPVALTAPVPLPAQPGHVRDGDGRAKGRARLGHSACRRRHRGLLRPRARHLPVRIRLLRVHARSLPAPAGQCDSARVRGSLVGATADSSAPRCCRPCRCARSPRRRETPRTASCMPTSSNTRESSPTAARIRTTRRTRCDPQLAHWNHAPLMSGHRLGEQRRARRARRGSTSTRRCARSSSTSRASR